MILLQNRLLIRLYNGVLSKEQALWMIPPPFANWRVMEDYNHFSNWRTLTSTNSGFKSITPLHQESITPLSDNLPYIGFFLSKNISFLKQMSIYKHNAEQGIAWNTYHWSCDGWRYCLRSSCWWKGVQKRYTIFLHPSSTCNSRVQGTKLWWQELLLDDNKNWFIPTKIYEACKYA
mgnify:CR=1 FL=1